MNIAVKCSKDRPRGGDGWRVAPVLMGEQVFVEAFSEGTRKRYFLHVDKAQDNRLVYRSSRFDATPFVIVPEAQRLQDPLRRQDLFYLRVAGSDALYIHVAQPFLRKIINLLNRTLSFQAYAAENRSATMLEYDNDNSDNRKERRLRLRQIAQAKKVVAEEGTALVDGLVQLQVSIENDPQLAAALRFDDSLIDAAGALKQLEPWLLTNDRAAMQQFTQTRRRIAAILQSLIEQTRQARLGGDSLQLFAVDRAETGIGSGVPLKLAAKPVRRADRSSAGDQGASRRFITYGQKIHLNAPVFRRSTGGRRDADIVCGQVTDANERNARRQNARKRNAEDGAETSCRLFEDNTIAVAPNSFSEDGERREPDMRSFGVDTFAFVCGRDGARRYFRATDLQFDLGSIVPPSSSPSMDGTPIDLDDAALQDGTDQIAPATQTNEVDERIDQLVQQAQNAAADTAAETQKSQADQRSAAAIEQTLLSDPAAGQELLRATQPAASVSSAGGLAWWVWTLIGAAILSLAAAIVFAVLYFTKKSKSGAQKSTETGAANDSTAFSALSSSEIAGEQLPGTSFESTL